MDRISLIVGLGNPGAEYDKTRHNAGAEFVEQLAAQHNSPLKAESKYFGLHSKIHIDGQPVHLLVPTTFMNRSGKSVAALANFFKIEPQEILVAHDELDIAPGVARLKKAAVTVATTVCGTSLPHLAITKIFIVCVSVLAIQAMPNWLQTSCSSVRRCLSATRHSRRLMSRCVISPQLSKVIGPER